VPNLITGIEFGINPELLMKKREKGEMDLPKKLLISCTLKSVESFSILTNTAWKALGFVISIRDVESFFLRSKLHEGKQVK